MKILANDGISNNAKETLEKNGFEVVTTKVAQEQLENFINEEHIDAILVKNNTQVRQELIEVCPSIKLIGCGNPDMDNIDADFAKENGVHVINTTDATANAIAELVFAHLFGMVRYLHQANRDMPLEGDIRFNSMQKQFSQGIELRGKTLGIIGNEPSANEVARIALGIGMKVVFSGDYTEERNISVAFHNDQFIDIQVETEPFKEVLSSADFVSLHLPQQEGYVIGNEQLKVMKDGVGIVNTCYGGAIDEVAIVKAIETGKVKYVGLDVFENEPTPEIQLLMNPELSFTPRIAPSTIEAKQKIDVDLAKQIIELLSE
ncbi:D-3-phosphoglycerate dehydrogenase [Tenacibaculum sp. 190524A02b]|uniref:NAD(P)-dependent oxidoreductase n=1 Tax=Tenacibaculum vairaonense TaxID=3137860 RepID=UPI0032B2C473